MKVSVVNLGCKVNQAEGEDLLNGFREAGFEVAGRGEPADVIIVNTCTVTNEADRKSRKAINRAIEANGRLLRPETGLAMTERHDNEAPRNDVKRPLVVVTGCYAGVAADELRKIEGVTVVVPQANKDKLVDQVIYVFASETKQSHGGDHPAEIAASAKKQPPRNDKLEHNHAPLNKNPKVRAFLKVQDGCDNRCAYCIVPDARGNPVSVPTDEVLAKAEELVKSGASEIVITGINVGKFSKGAENGERGAGKPLSLDELINELLKTKGLKRLRISSIEPEDVTLDLIGLMAAPGSPPTAPYLCSHLHIPLQSGDRRVLQRMGRRYTPSDFLRLCNTIRHACPDAAITTDVIVGFPGETDQEFANTIMMLEQTKPSRIHVFKYSKRTGTPAAEMPDQVRDDVKAARSEAVRGLGDRLAAEYRASFAGLELDVLVEYEKDGMLIGTTENYLTISMPGSKADIGKIIKFTV